MRVTVHSESKVPPCTQFAWQPGANVASATGVVLNHAEQKDQLS